MGAQFSNQNPSYQIDYYLRVSGCKWGILTNGRQWRLYFSETSYKFDSYFEIDLVDILEREDFTDFKSFFLFFRKESFIELDNESLLDRVQSHSTEYSEELEEDLKDRVFQAFEYIARGFFFDSHNKLKNTKKSIQLVREESLILLYRILFLLYAESRGLLELDNPEYRDHLSLTRIKNRIAEGFVDLGWVVKGYRGTVEKVLPETFIVDGKGHIKRKKPRM